MTAWNPAGKQLSLVFVYCTLSMSMYVLSLLCALLGGGGGGDDGMVMVVGMDDLILIVSLQIC